MSATNSATNAILRQTKSSHLQFMDIFGITRDSKEDYYNDLQNSMGQLAEDDGSVTLSDGREIDMNSVAGMTVFSGHVQLLQANMEMIDNVYSFIRNYENKLGNLLSS